MRYNARDRILQVVAVISLGSTVYSFQGNSHVICGRPRGKVDLDTVNVVPLAQRQDSIPEQDQQSTATQTFQTWFEAHPRTFISPSLEYAEFSGGLKGLSWRGSNPFVRGENDGGGIEIGRIPGDISLQADYTDRNWDVQLAMQLCREMDKGHESHLWGYFALLPDQPAPNAIRHWSSSQLQRIEVSEAGRRLAQASDRQMQRWRQAYDALPSKTKDTLSWDRFEWALETVNSRSFCGLPSPSGLAWRSLGAPLLAAATAWAYMRIPDNEPSELMLIGLAVAALVPTLVQIVRPTAELVYMLPLVELVNHRAQSNDASIRWDPLRQHFSFVIGPQCLVKEDDGQTQVYWNYSDKSDAEWLLNFGFLPSVSGNDVTSDDLRRRFAEEFVRRNE